MPELASARTPCRGLKGWAGARYAEARANAPPPPNRFPWLFAAPPTTCVCVVDGISETGWPPRMCSRTLFQLVLLWLATLAKATNTGLLAADFSAPGRINRYDIVHAGASSR